MIEPNERDRKAAHKWALEWFGDGFESADLDAVGVNDLVAVIATAREEGRKEALKAERERCADIVDRHPDESHPAIFDPEEIRGCCEVMAARIRSGEP